MDKDIQELQSIPKEEMMMVAIISELSTIKNWAESISSEWNGDEPGLQEDRANCAQDIIEKSKELEELLAEMQELGI